MESLANRNIKKTYWDKWKEQILTETKGGKLGDC